MSSMDGMLIMTQHEANSRPTAADIKATRRILKDFGIRNIKIPDCKTVAELTCFQTATIHNKLYA